MRTMHQRPVTGNEIPCNNSSQSVIGNDGFLKAKSVRERYGVTDMTIWRWLRDEKIGFPQPVYIGRYRYWRAEALAEWETAQATRQEVA